ncbi:MAG TPA: LCP family protein [Candidatus Saccharimonadales bacterium]|nr:LCP family protein [Candidatus Saccharimonadales bacterium]
MPTSQEGRPRGRSSFAAAFLSLIFPGLGHAYAGAWSRALAFAAAPLLLVALVAGIALRVDRLELFGFLLQPDVLTGILLVNAVVLVYRVIAAVDAWRVASYLNSVDAGMDPRGGRPPSALGPASLGGLLAVLLVMSGAHVAVAYYDLQAQQLDCIFDATTNSCGPDPTGTAPPSGAGASAAPTDSPAPTTSLNVGTPNPSAAALPAPSISPWTGGRLNILLIGADQRPKDATFNTDTLIVVSIDPASREVALFSIPRDTVDVPLPPGPAQSVFGTTYQGKINSLWTAARLRSDLFPGNDAQRGYIALKQTIAYLYQIPINYYVEVNFDGFREVVDALGGVTINVQIPVMDDYYPGDDGRLHRIYIPTGIQHMTGAQALIYARSRHASSDFDRAQRQQRVLLSLRQQSDIGSLIGKLPDLVSALRAAVHTDLPLKQLPQLLALAGEIDTTNLRSYVFAPPLYGTEYNVDPTGQGRGYVLVPNIARIRAAVAAAFTSDPGAEAEREKVSAENGVVWVVGGSGDPSEANTLAAYLEYEGMSASAPNLKPDLKGLAGTRVNVYNNAQDRLPATIALLQQLFGKKINYITDKTVKADIIITTTNQTPNLTPPPGP